MYALGIPFTQYVDDYLPTDNGVVPMFANIGKDGSIWGAIVEKAYAKRYGNYQHMEGGWMATGVANLNGSPFKTYLHYELSNDNEIWAILSTHDQDKDIMTAGTTNDNKETNLPGGHAYTIIGITTVQKNGEEVRLIKVRNPWGSEEYTGPWSDSSSEWTPELRAEVASKMGGADKKDDGIFYMDITTYRTNFTETQINQDTSAWNMSHFLMLGDSKRETVNEDKCIGCT